MTIHRSYADVQKVTVTLPGALLSRLDQLIPTRGRSRFILEAIEERLDLEEQQVALAETAGAWTDENHPDMKNAEDIDQWLDELRRAWGEPEVLDRG